MLREPQLQTKRESTSLLIKHLELKLGAPQGMAGFGGHEDLSPALLQIPRKGPQSLEQQLPRRNVKSYGISALAPAVSHV